MSVRAGDGAAGVDVPAPAGLVLAEMGQTPDHIELVGYSADSLITAKPAIQDMHVVYSFIGDDGTNRRKYIHSGRAVARAD